MTRLLLSTIAGAALAVPGDVLRAAPASQLVHAGSGITTTLPAGWHFLRFPVSGCADPVQRFAAATKPESKLSVVAPLASGATLVVLTEDAVNDPRSFPGRPSRFRLPAKPERFAGCCGMPLGPGYEFSFRDHGRDFEAYIFARNPLTTTVRLDSVAILNSLRIAPQ